MHVNKMLLIGVVALLLLNTIMVTVPVSAEPAPAGGAAIWVEPDFVNGTLVGLGNNFTVEVKINVSDSAGAEPYGMFGFAYWLTWNDTLLNCSLAAITVYLPGDVDPWFWSGGHSTVANKLLDTDDNGIMDTHSYAETALGVAGGFNGTMTLAEYTMTVAYEPLNLTISTLDITNKGIVDVDGNSITTTVSDGTYEIIIPEFPLALILPLFMVATLAAVILGKTWLRKRRNPFVAQ